MIIREWRGRASPKNVGAYPAHFHAAVLPAMRHIPGFLGAFLGRRQIGGEIEYLVLTRWNSFDAIRDFAGDDIGKAVVGPDAAAALCGFDAHARHYDVVEAVSV